MDPESTKVRTFTLTEAQGLLGKVRALTEEAVKRTDKLSVGMQGLSQTDPAHASAAKEFDEVIMAWTDKLRAMGLEVKGLWLVDFDNGEGYYCWKYPESTILHYHSYDEGFAGRIKIT